MIQITEDSLKMLLDRVNEWKTVRIEFTFESTTIEVLFARIRRTPMINYTTATPVIAMWREFYEVGRIC